MTDAAPSTPDLESMTAWRRSFHRHPELGFEEFQTSAFVAGKLAEWGCEVTTGIAGTGLVGRLRFGDGGRQLGLRAEMDALPIQEATGLPWASQIPGKMHGCGHDGHTAMLLGAAQGLAALHRRGVEWDGTLNLIFQPAEELGGAGGARRMMDELFERFPCDAVFAMHNYPGRPVGHFYVREGAFMASSDRAVITFKGSAAMALLISGRPDGCRVGHRDGAAKHCGAQYPIRRPPPWSPWSACRRAPPTASFRNRELEQSIRALRPGARSPA
ncbi:amidohydrolase [Cupriavidus basilensis]